MRVGILGFSHESNTFVSQPTHLPHFEQDFLLSGDEIRTRLAGGHHEVSGFFSGLADSDVEIVPIFLARAVPGGTISAGTFDTILARMWQQLDRAGSLDGILAAPHGAAVSENHSDADGFWLSELRNRVGTSLPIIATMDPHGNLSPRMVGACTALIAYRTNPHLDQKQRGEEAAGLMLRTLSAEVRPTMAASFLPLLINIERQATSEPHWQSHYNLASEQLLHPHILSNSIVLGFPYSDVPKMGASTITITDGDPTLAQQTADELAASIWKRRNDFVGHFVSVQQALDKAVSHPGPTCLLDMGDNVGGGSSADGTELLHALAQRKIGSSFICLCDPAAVEIAQRSPIGSNLTLTVGGKTDNLHGPPFSARFTLQHICDGKFHESQPRHGGWTEFDQGPTVILRGDFGLTIMLTSRRMPPFSLNQLTSCGLRPEDFRVLVAKGVNAPIAAYAPVCKQLIRVNTIGSTTADIHHLNYSRRRKPLFPFEPETTWPAPVNF